MKTLDSKDRLNLRLLHQSGKLFNSDGAITIPTIILKAKKIPFLQKYFSHGNAIKVLDDMTGAMIVSAITDDKNERIYYTNPANDGLYITREQRFGSKEGYQQQQFYQALTKALRLSPSIEVTDALMQVVHLVKE